MTAILPDATRPARLAGVLTRELAAEAADAQARWDAASLALRGQSAEDQLTVLRAFAALADSYLVAVESARRLWAELGGPAGEGAAAVAAAGRVFEKMRREATRAVEHRLTPWTPKDPERFEQAMRDVREGRAKFFSPEEIRAYFRQTPV